MSDNRPGSHGDAGGRMSLEEIMALIGVDRVVVEHLKDRLLTTKGGCPCGISTSATSPSTDFLNPCRCYRTGYSYVPEKTITFENTHLI